MCRVEDGARDRLVRGAGELLWERGYVAASPRAIQQRAYAGQGSMYHHFATKHALAREAITVLADDAERPAEAVFAGTGTALARVVGYLRMERDVLLGCPVGRLTQDPEVAAADELRRPVQRHLSWLTEQLTGLLTQARHDGELPAELDPVATAAAVAATVQGGYVLARSADSPALFTRAVDGALALLK